MLKFAGKSNSVVAVVARYMHAAGSWVRIPAMRKLSRQGEFVAARREIEELLDLLEGRSTGEKFPWLTDAKELWRAEWRYAGQWWRPQTAGLYNINSDFIRWGTYSLQADVPFPCIFYLGELKSAMSCSSDRTEEVDMHDRPFTSTTQPTWPVLVSRTQRLQTRWIGMYFLLPLDGDDTFYSSVFGFTGHIILLNLKLAAVARAFLDGSAFNTGFMRRLQGSITGQVAEAAAGASIADLLFLHFAVLRLWDVIHGHKEFSEKEFLASLQSSRFASYDASNVALHIFIPLFHENPLSVLFLNGVFCDLGIVDDGPSSLEAGFTDAEETECETGGDGEEEDDENELPATLVSLFNRPLTEDAIMMLADYYHLGLRAPVIVSGSAAIGKPVSRTYIDALSRRLRFTAGLLGSGFDRLQGVARSCFLMFCARFFVALLHDWLTSLSSDKAARQLPGVATTTMPQKVTLAVIKLGMPPERIGSTIDTIAGKLHAGQEFEDLAREYSTDNSSAIKGGNLGTVELGELDPTLEAAVFLSDNGMNLFSVVEDKATYLVQVQDRIFAKCPKDLDLLVRHAVFADKELRSGLQAMLGVLARLVDEEAIQDRLGDDLLRLSTLAEKGLKYKSLLAFEVTRMVPR
ncbi:MAG: peptidylprolyl isomerase [Gammaproteobacteria bacterium]|nr:peptidylprolyl isomerase [Gammaproteobacteria bacterium]